MAILISNQDVNSRRVEISTHRKFHTEDWVVSLTKKYQWSADSKEQRMYPLYPNEIEISRQYGNRFIRFAIAKSDYNGLPANSDTIFHISEKCKEFCSSELCIDQTCVYAFISNQQLVLQVHRLSEVIFVNVFQFQDEIELLYFIQLAYRLNGLDQNLDRLVLCGSVADDSKIAQTCKIYFKKVQVNFTLE